MFISFCQKYREKCQKLTQICNKITILIKLNSNYMDQDLKEGLLSKKGATFNKMYEDCMVRIQRIKQKNDLFQKQIGTDIQQSIRSQVTNQKKFIQKEINELKDMMLQMESKHKDPESKNKIKQLKTNAQKQDYPQIVDQQVEIHKIRSFLAHSIGRSQQPEDTARYMEGGRIDYQSLVQPNRQVKPQENVRQHQESLLTDNYMEVDYEIQRKILLEKNEMINQVEQSTLRINDIMNEIGVMVEQQGQNLDVISQQLLKTNQNLVQTNKNMDQAVSLQKKSRRKYVVLVIILIIIIAIVVGVVVILKT